MQKDANLFIQDFKAASAWSISSKHIESGAGTFPHFGS